MKILELKNKLTSEKVTVWDIRDVDIANNMVIVKLKDHIVLSYRLDRYDISIKEE